MGMGMVSPRTICQSLRSQSLAVAPKGEGDIVTLSLQLLDLPQSQNTHPMSPSVPPWSFFFAPPTTAVAASICRTDHFVRMVTKVVGRGSSDEVFASYRCVGGSVGASHIYKTVVVAAWPTLKTPQYIVYPQDMIRRTYRSIKSVRGKWGKMGA